jgi:hypothetical protein
MKKQPIFTKILIPLMLLVLLEIGILLVSIYSQGLFDLIHKNSQDIVESRVEARRNYLESLMVNQWMNLGQTVQKINLLADGLVDAGKMDIEAIDDSSENAAPFLNAVSDDIISMMRTNHVTGAFMILNADNLEESMKSMQYIDKPGLYFRDLDPESRASEDNLDLMILRSPLMVARNKQIATDKSWNTSFQFGTAGVPYYDFLYEPTQATFYSKAELTWEDMGFWSKPYTLFGETREAIAYSVPLRLSDGRVYGVLGVDILLDYLRQNLPARELDNGGSASYFIGIHKNGIPEVSSSSYHDVIQFNTSLPDVGEDEDGKIVSNAKQYFTFSMPLHLFSTVGPYTDTEWQLGAILPYKTMNRFANRMIFVMSVTIIMTLLIGIVGSLVISLFLQKPIRKLALAIRSNKTTDKLRLKETGILEIDQMSEALEDLSDRLLQEQRNLQYERDHDFLTDLYNRRAFGRRIRELLEKKGGGNAIGAYIMMDLDNLKIVNDTYGHEYGDKYIRCASDAMREGLGDEAIYSRISGDEFNVFIFDEEGNRSRINYLIERLQETIDKSFIMLPEGEKKQLRLSGGVSWYPEGGTNPDQLQKNADYAMYVVKKTTKSQIRVWSEATDLGKEKEEEQEEKKEDSRLELDASRQETELKQEESKTEPESKQKEFKDKPEGKKEDFGQENGLKEPEDEEKA